jgi:hypothetical protein
VQVRSLVSVSVELLLSCVLALLGASSVFVGSVSVLEKFDNFFKALFSSFGKITLVTG